MTSSQYPLANRLFKLVFSWYLALAVAVTGIQLTLEYFTVVDGIDVELNSLSKAFAYSTADALWTFDMPLLETMVRGIAESPIITGVEIRNPKGLAVVSNGAVPQDGVPVDTGAMAPYRMKSVTLTVRTPRGDVAEVGQLVLVSDRQVAFDRVKYSFLVIFINSLVKTAGLWLIFYLVITKTIAADIRKVTDSISRLKFFDDPPKELEEIEYIHRDELGGLFEAMRNLRNHLGEARQEVRELQRSLEFKVEERTKELQRSNEELEQFAYVVSHDLREPLRMVSSFVSLLEKKFSGVIDNEAHEYIAFARNGALRMDHLIRDLLDYSRIGRSGQVFVSLRLDELIREALLNLRSLLEASGGKVVLPPTLPEIRGNQTELIRLFQNLIGNALKYRDPERASVVEISTETTGDVCTLSIKDNGIGIAPEHFDRVFGIFQRLHSHDSYEGTGIGLAVCKKIVEHHGGRIWIESIPKEGTTFFFTLHLSEAALRNQPQDETGKSGPS